MSGRVLLGREVRARMPAAVLNAAADAFKRLLELRASRAVSIAVLTVKVLLLVVGLLVSVAIALGAFVFVSASPDAFWMKIFAQIHANHPPPIPEQIVMMRMTLVGVVLFAAYWALRCFRKINEIAAGVVHAASAVFAFFALVLLAGTLGPMWEMVRAARSLEEAAGVVGVVGCWFVGVGAWFWHSFRAVRRSW